MARHYLHHCCLIQMKIHGKAFPSFVCDVAFAAGCAYNGTVYISGGRSSLGCDKFTIEYKHMYACTPGKNRWIQLAPMPQTCYKHTMFTLKSMIYIFGGFHNDTVIKTACAFSPESNQWTSVHLRGDIEGLSVSPNKPYAICRCKEHSDQAPHCLVYFQYIEDKLVLQCLAQLDFLRSNTSLPLLCCASPSLIDTLKMSWRSHFA